MTLQAQIDLHPAIPELRQSQFLRSRWNGRLKGLQICLAAHAALVPAVPMELCHGLSMRRKRTLQYGPFSTKWFRIWSSSQRKGYIIGSRPEKADFEKYWNRHRITSPVDSMCEVYHASDPVTRVCPCSGFRTCGAAY